MPLTADCVFCSKQFQYYPSRPRKYCSANCRDGHKKKLAGMDTERICPQCGISYLPKFNYQKICSKKCGNEQGSKLKEKIYKFNCKNYEKQLNLTFDLLELKENEKKYNDANKT